MNIRRPLFLLILLNLMTGVCAGQGKHISTVFLEGATRGPSFSLNYDRIFYKGKKISYAYRAGLHWLNQEIGVPLGISLITGKNDHHAELSLTFTPYVKKANYLFRDGNVSDKYLYITPGVGYRFQKPTGGFFLKALVAPLIFLDPPSDDFWNMDPKVFPVLCVGAGYTF